MKRIPIASNLLRRRRLSSASASAAAVGFAGRTVQTRPANSPYPYWHHSPPRRSPHRTAQCQINNGRCFSSLAQDWDGYGDDDEIKGGGDGGDGDGRGGNHPPKPKKTGLLPTRHSRNLPPLVCPLTALRSEVELIFDAPIGSLIIYNAQSQSGIELGAGMGEIKSVEEEIADAYYASDAIVQRVEYIMRGLNARVSEGSFVARNLARGTMAYNEEDNGSVGEAMARQDCFRAMLDLMERMAKEGEAYVELRTRIRSQVVDPWPSEAARESGSSSDSSDSSSSDDSDDEGGVDEADDSFNEWKKSVEKNMDTVNISNPNIAGLRSADSKKDEGDVQKAELSEEHYQFGADPGVTTHMFDLVLDSLACLCQERYGTTNPVSDIELAELLPNGGSPPEVAKEMLDVVLHRHWMDGGDIGLGGGGSEQNAMGKFGQGVGGGSGTGAGALENVIPPDIHFDVRTCPTPMTFNAVLRVAANFNPAAHAEAVENALVLGGVARSAGSGLDLEHEKERLRDVAIDAALTTFSRMQYCVALTLRTIRRSSGNATSRSALKRQAKILAGNYKPKEQNNFVSGRNSATYSYLIQTVANCIPPSLSRGNMTFGLYHKGCVKEGVMDVRLIQTMRGVGGYEDGDGEDVLEDTVEEGGGDVPTPPVSNGPIFDEFMRKDLGVGVEVALEKGRKLRQDRNYKLRRHVEWDDTY